MNRYIINADDYGLNRSCTEAILEAFKKKLISSSTMCANGSYFYEACTLAKKNNVTDVIGIHLNLTEGEPLTDGIRNDLMFCDQNGLFHSRINRLKPLGKLQRKHIYEELSAQIERMWANGFPITHADSHHHIHTGIFIAPVCLSVLKTYGINKIRLHRNFGLIVFYKLIVKKLFNFYIRHKGFKTTDYFGSIEDINAAPVDLCDKFVEIMVHPDYDAAGCLIDKTGFDGVPTGKNLDEEFKPLLSWLYSYNDI